MASITKQPNGRWRARYRDVHDRTRSKTFDRKQDAQNFLDSSGSDMQRGEWIDPARRRESFDSWADRWWATTVKLRPTTRGGYNGILERHVRPYFSGRRVVDINFMDVEDFIAVKLSAKLSPKYVREAVSVLSLIMQSAQKSNVRRDNPAAGHKVMVRRRKLRTGDVLSMEQVHQLVARIRDPYKSAVWLLILAGLRPAELCGLRVGSVDFIRGVIHVSETLLPVHKYGDEPYDSAVLGPTKTDAGNRRIPIPRWLCTDLASLLAERADLRGTPTTTEEYLFQTRYGNPLNRDKLREKVIRPALSAAGLPDSIRTYDLRHSHASLLIDMGANVLAVAQRMGHSDPAVTLREYGHLFEGVQAHLTEQLDGLRMATAGNSPSKASIVPMKGGRRTRARHTGHAKDTISGSEKVKTGQGR